DLEEVGDLRPYLVTDGAVGGDRSRHYDNAIAREQFSDEPDASNVGVPVFLAESQALRQVSAHDVAVEQLDIVTAVPNLVHQELGHRTLAGTGQAGEPNGDTRGFLFPSYA